MGEKITKTEAEAALELQLAELTERNRLLKAENDRMKAQLAEADQFALSPELKELVRTKVAAGLPRETAIRVARNQLAENARRAEAAKAEAEAKKNAKAK